jgi:hypothetical protein
MSKPVVPKKKPTQTPSKNVSLDQYNEVKKQLEQMQKKEDVMMRKLDRVRGKMDWAFRHPFRFMLGRVYHQYIKRDQKNVKI